MLIVPNLNFFYLSGAKTWKKTSREKIQERIDIVTELEKHLGEGELYRKGIKIETPKDNIPASFPAADQEIHVGSLPEKLGNLPFLHIV